MSARIIMSIDADDPYITVTDNSESFGTIQPGDSLTVIAAFSFDAASDIPNDYSFKLNTEIVSSAESWEGEINLQAYAPVIEHSTIDINDNDDGILDPGESAEIDVTINNNGGSSANEINLQISSSDPYAVISNTSSYIDILEPGNEDIISFDITVDESAPLGHVIQLTLDITAADGYSNSKTIGLSVGLLFEDFETNDFLKFPWELSGDNNWQITDDIVYEGMYACQSGDINDSEDVILSLEMNVLAEGDISFYKRVSCENDPNGTGYDYLAFIVDGMLMGSWDGEIDWSEESYTISPGMHTFQWVYHKDVYVSEGSDCAWIDYIVFPPLQTGTIDINDLEEETQINPVKIIPNPFSNETSIIFHTENSGTVNLEIFDMNGKKVKTLLSNSVMQKGDHVIKWKGENDSDQSLPEGIYFYKLFNGKQFTGTVILMK